MGSAAMILKNENDSVVFVFGLPVNGRLAALGLQWSCSGSAAAAGVLPISNFLSTGVSDFLLENARLAARFFQKAPKTGASGGFRRL